MVDKFTAHAMILSLEHTVIFQADARSHWH